MIEVKGLDDATPLSKIEKLLRDQLLVAGFHPEKSSDPFAFIVGLNPSADVSGFLRNFYSGLTSEEKCPFVERLVPYCITMRCVVSENLAFLAPLIEVDLKKEDNWTFVSLTKGLDEDPKSLAEKYRALSEETSAYKRDLLMEFIG